MKFEDAEVTPFETPWRSAAVIKIVDADTFDIRIDLGFDVHTTARVRLVQVAALKIPDVGFDAWEIKGPERDRGKTATARVEFLLQLGSEVRVQSRKGGSRESLGRWLCCVLYRDSGSWTSLADTLLAEGHGEEWWKGKSDGKPRPVS